MGKKMKYETRNCRILMLPENTFTRKVEIYDVKIALGSWDGEEDAEDESIWFYMDGLPLEIGSVLGEGFVIIDIEGE